MKEGGYVLLNLITSLQEFYSLHDVFLSRCRCIFIASLTINLIKISYIFYEEKNSSLEIELNKSKLMDKQKWSVISLGNNGD